MIDPGDAIAHFVVFGDFRSEGDNNSDKVAPYCSACGRVVVDVLPVIAVSRIPRRSITIVSSSYQSVGLIATAVFLTSM